MCFSTSDWSRSQVSNFFAFLIDLIFIFFRAGIWIDIGDIVVGRDEFEGDGHGGNGEGHEIRAAHSTVGSQV